MRLNYSSTHATLAIPLSARHEVSVVEAPDLAVEHDAHARYVNRRDEFEHIAGDPVNTRRLEDVARHGEKQDQAGEGHVEADVDVTSDSAAIGPWTATSELRARRLTSKLMKQGRRNR